MKFLRFTIFILALAFAAPLRAELVDGVVAVVNDTAITRQQVQDLAGPAIDSLRRQYAPDSEEYAQKLNAVFTNSLELLVERQLILHEFNVEGYRMPESYLDQVVQERIRDQFGDRMTLMKTLQAEGMTLEQFRDDVRDRTIETFMRTKNVGQAVVVSPYEIQQYYHAHPADFKVEEQVKLRMIVLNKSSPDDSNTVALAQDIITKIKGGASFADMASVYSQGMQQKQGGDMGWVDRSTLRKELSDVAFALKPGEVSNVVDLPEACYILSVEDKHPAHIEPLKDARDEIENTLRTQERTRLERQWIDSLKKKTFIRYF